MSKANSDKYLPKVSILIPAFNEEAFIADCLISIVNQSYFSWEAIVVDDHSTDATFEIINGFQRKDKRFLGVKNKGKGIISALKTAYGLSSGEYITRMDADDLMRTNKIEVLLSGLLAKGDRHVAVGGVHYFAEEKLKSGFKTYQNWLNQHTEKGTNFNDILKECVIPSPCWMLSRKDLDSINAFEENRYPEDYDLVFRMYAKGFQVVPTEELIHEWRDYETRTSKTSENYKDYTFTEIKWHYFEKLHHQKDKQLLVLGTGYRGKKLAKHLLKQGVEFLWISNNESKIGKNIYGQLIHSMSTKLDWKTLNLLEPSIMQQGRNFLKNF